MRKNYEPLRTRSIAKGTQNPMRFPSCTLVWLMPLFFRARSDLGPCAAPRSAVGFACCSKFAVLILANTGGEL